MCTNMSQYSVNKGHTGTLKLLQFMYALPKKEETPHLVFLNAENTQNLGYSAYTYSELKALEVSPKNCGFV